MRETDMPVITVLHCGNYTKMLELFSSCCHCCFAAVVGGGAAAVAVTVAVVAAVVVVANAAVCCCWCGAAVSVTSKCRAGCVHLR